jgi:cardiolipin synthase
VNIYEFTPGFIHNKTIVSDDEKAIVGTANFDYRSFYLHFENGVWLYGSKAVLQAKESFENALSRSQRVTKEQIEETPWGKRLICSLLKVFAPLF